MQKIAESLSSFIVQPYRRRYLEEYARRMSTDNTHALWDDNVASVLEEQGFSIQESPRSVYRVEKLYDALAKYAPTAAPRVDLKLIDLQRGVSLAHACFACPDSEHLLELEDFTPDLVWNITSNRKGSSGLTAWGQTKAESYVRAYERGLQQILGEKRPEPCIAFKRTQFNDKTRLVWGYPYAMTAIEGIFARPLITQFKGGTSPMAFGLTTGALGTKLRLSSYHKQWAYSVDVSSFDSAIPKRLIEEAFRILATWFDMSRIEQTSGVSYNEIWKQIIHYFIHTPIVMPDLQLYKGKKHGVPSGSYFTQIVDSIVNVMIVGAIAHQFSLSVDKEDIFVLGDDVLFWSNRLVSLEHISLYASRVFGMKFNSEKSSVTKWDEDITYLGRLWQEGVPTLDEESILIRMTQPESYRKYPNNRKERERQVKLLLLSYAAVYKDAYRIYLWTVNGRLRWNRTNASIEYNVYGDMSPKVFQEMRPETLTGLLRYQLKYVQDGDDRGYHTPLALLLWK